MLLLTQYDLLLYKEELLTAPGAILTALTDSIWHGLAYLFPDRPQLP